LIVAIFTELKRRCKEIGSDILVNFSFFPTQYLLFRAIFPAEQQIRLPWKNSS